MQDPKSEGTQAPASGWKFKADTQVESHGPTISKSVESVSWTASEFIAHDKSAGWYITLAFGSIALAAAVYLFSRGDLVSTAVVFIVATVFGIFAARKPRELQYVVDNKGIQIGDKLYPYSKLRS